MKIILHSGTYTFGEVRRPFAGVLVPSNEGRDGWPIYRGSGIDKGTVIAITDAVFDEESGTLRFTLRRPGESWVITCALFRKKTLWAGTCTATTSSGVPLPHGSGSISCHVETD